jgi:small subunit ribosomal protein S16
MVVIRLSRGGTNKRPFYHVYVTDSRKPRDSGYIECLGYFNPIAVGGETKIKLETARITDWISKGAKASPRVMKLIKDFAATNLSAESAKQ